MTRRTRPARTSLMLCLAALALTSVCAIAPRLRAAQTTAPPARVARDPSARLGTIRLEWLLYALRAREADEPALVRLVERRGVDSYPSAEDERELRAAGATDRLLEAVRKHVATPPPTIGGFGPGIGTGPRIGTGRGVGPGEGGPGPNYDPVDYTRPFRQNEVLKRATINFRPEPDLTDEARKHNVSGVVRLRAVLNFSGGVTDISVIRGLPDGLTEQAVAAARRIRFTPAEKDGRKVSQYVVLEYKFNLTPDEKKAAERAAVVNKTFNKSEVDEPAIILETPEPEYTREARRNNARGKVRLKLRLMDSGFVVVESVEAELPYGLTAKAAEAATRIKFQPARRGGRHVTQRATVEYVFNP